MAQINNSQVGCNFEYRQCVVESTGKLTAEAQALIDSIKGVLDPDDGLMILLDVSKHADAIRTMALDMYNANMRTKDAQIQASVNAAIAFTASMV